MQNPHRARWSARQYLGPMRRYLVIAAALSSLYGSVFPARSDEVPNLDVRPVCRGIASQSAGSLDLGRTEQVKQCVTSEQEVRAQLKTEWRTFSVADKRHCVSLIKMGGESSYTELITCLEMARDVRALKVESSATSPGTTVKPAASTPSTQPPPATAAQSAPFKSSRLMSELQRQREREKSDADTAKKSEEAALRRATIAEAAQQKEKEEAERLRTELETAKADAQSAKIAQDSLERKVAALESPQPLAEHRTAEMETAERRSRFIIIALSVITGALVVTVFYLLRKLRIVGQN